ncbi:MAG: T9SS type A sorting domain-containing protein [Bacteroidetes bacterium]|nr:T9SS type A sorting domain-containing protein [Bacteroidota bacterium]
MTAYPNPFNTSLIISTQNTPISSLTVYTILGQVVREENDLFGSSIILERDNLPGGDILCGGRVRMA